MRAILTYHSIDDSGSPISIDAAAFRRHVEWLASGAVRVVPLELLVNAVDADAFDSVAITFDDGLESVETVALPLLRDHGLPATVFIVSDAVGGSNAWGGVADRRVPRFPLMGWTGVRRLVDSGFALGAHSRTHPRLSSLSLSAIEDEVLGSRERIAEETGVGVTTFAYPFGDADDRVGSVVARHFQLACGTELRTLRAGDDLYRLPRLDAYYLRAPGRLEAWGSSRFRVMLGVRGHARRIRRSVERSI